MPASLVCPSCGSAPTSHRPPVTNCPNCQAALPAALRQAAEASLLRQKAPRPTLLTIGLYTAPAAGMMLVLAVLLAAVNASFVRYTVNGETVSGHEFLRTAGAAFGAMRSEEHTSELQSPCNLVCRLLLETKKELCVSSPY